MYTKEYINLHLCPERNDMPTYLYSNYYNEVMHINENGSLNYYRDSSGKLYISSNLYSGFDVWCVEDNDYVSITFDELNESFFKLDKSEILPFETFEKILEYLSEWTGEYGDYIFDIDFDNICNMWVIEWRIEGIRIRL